MINGEVPKNAENSQIIKERTQERLILESLIHLVISMRERFTVVEIADILNQIPLSRLVKPIYDYDCRK